RVKPGIFGLLRYPEMPPEPEAVEPPKERATSTRGAARASAESSADEARAERGRRRRRRGGRGRGRGDEAPAGHAANGVERAGEAAEADAGGARDDDGEGHGADVDAADEHEPKTGSQMSPEARAAALAETGVLEHEDAHDDD